MIKAHVIFIYLLSLLLVGICYLCIQPVFEGFDETAHYSSIRQMSDTASIPLYGVSYLDKSVTTYQGPMHYGSGNPPFDNALTYNNFFKDPLRVSTYIKQYRELPLTQPFQKSEDLNWQAQHPPLYYFIFAQIYRFFHGHVSFTSEFFILRLCSYLLALGGVLLGLFAVRHYTSLDRHAALKGFILYPLILPMFFPEFARLGNDALCIFLVGALTCLLPLWDKKIVGFFIGVILGIGCLSKGFFIPISAGVLVFLLVKIWRERKNLFLLIPIFLPMILLGGSWYLYQYITLGHIAYSADAEMLASQGGFIANWQLHYSVKKLITGMLGPFRTYIWAGSWSLVGLHVLFYVPLVFLLSWLCFSAFFYLKKHSFTHLSWLPVLIMTLFILGFVAHVIVCIAAFGTGNTPGWYLHILMPWTAPLIGFGAARILSQKKNRIIFMGLVFYAVMFQIIALWSQLALYTGCAVKSIENYYSFPGHYFCLDQAPLLLARLSVFGWPSGMLLCFGFGFLTYFYLIRRIF